MTYFPRILVMDDQYASSSRDGIIDREAFCQKTGIADSTHTDSAVATIEPVADGVFFSGQVVRDGSVENDLSAAMDFIRRGWREPRRWTLLLLDLHFKTGPLTAAGEPVGRDEDRHPHNYFGLKVLEAIQGDPELRDIPIVMLSSMKREEIESRFSEGGSLDFIDKTELNRDEVRRLLAFYGLMEDIHIVGRSLPLMSCLREARVRSREGNGNILIVGETGTGKELLSSYIHSQSGRTGQFITVFTQGVPESLIEDRLFGHVKGAFTGAKTDEPGAGEQAQLGTLFIDEFGDIPGAIQHKLLRLLDTNTREVQRLGSGAIKKVDILVVMATNRFEILSSGDFLQDVLYRVNASKPIILPPLRERTGDHELLVEYFLRKCEKKYNAQTRDISPEAMERVKAYAWPGNIRQLADVIDDAVRSYRGLRHLSARHLNLPDTNAPAMPVPRTEPEEKTPPLAGRPPAPSLEELLETIESLSVNNLTAADLSGKLPQVQRAFALLMTRLLSKAIQATGRPTLENPDGDIVISRAMKVISGNEKLTTQQAYDIIKRAMKIHVPSQADILQDPLLKDAYERAIQKRPSNKRTPK